MKRKAQLTANLLWTILVLVFFLDLLLAAVRGSLLNARLPSLMEMGEAYPDQVRATMELLKKPRLRSSMRLGSVLAHVFLGGLAAWLAAWFFQPAHFWLELVLVAAAALALLVVEHLLEGLILPNAEIWALRLTGTARVIDILFSPLSSILVRLLGSPALLEQRFGPVTEYELRTWVDQGEKEGGLDQGEREMIYSIFHFGDTLCREIMVPRIDMLALDLTTSLNDAVQAMSQSGHSRVPVYEETVDNIIGMLYAKDLLKARLEDETLFSLRGSLRPTYFVPESKKVDQLLDEMQILRIHMAIVVDEYGGVAGLVTLEDIVEEIVGEIRDEYDQGEEQLFTEIAPGEYSFSPRIDLNDFNEVMNSHIGKDKVDTLGGLMYALIGQVPKGGETILVDGLALTVEQVTGRRIRKVHASPAAQITNLETEEKEHDAEH
jgi:putative hemolysin